MLLKLHLAFFLLRVEKVKGRKQDLSGFAPNSLQALPAFKEWVLASMRGMKGRHYESRIVKLLEEKGYAETAIDI